MLLRDPHGQVVEALITTEQAQSPLRVPRLVLQDGQALGPGDVRGWAIIEADPAERVELRRGGYVRDRGAAGEGGGR